MKVFVPISVFIFITSLTAQRTHPPTVANCEAHERLFSEKVEASYDANVDYLPAWDTISQWAGEMEECETTDPNNHAAYQNLKAKIQAFKSIRQMHFLVRRHLYDQFVEEDKSGKR